MEITEASQLLSPDSMVTMFTFDASAIKGGILRWSDSPDVVFQGVSYPPFNFACEGFAWDGDTLPRPTITASIADNTGRSISQQAFDLIVGYKGGQGATVYRTRTLARYLDGHEDGGQGICYVTDVYLVDRILSMTKSSVKWELITPFDLPDCKLPCRQALRDVCPWVYRHWADDHFIYDTTEMACPYTGDKYFDKNGEETTADKDNCGRRFSDCLKRYGQGTPLPYGGFPGLARASEQK